MTPEQAAAAVVAKARSQVGIRYTGSWSKYGAWWHPNWANSLWCAMFASWCFDQALGTSNAVKVIGREYSWSTGHAWTVSFYNWMRANGTKVSWNNARPGDVMFFRFRNASGGRSANPTNHMDIVVSPVQGTGAIPTVGGNTPKPGTGGDPSAGRGVWVHYRTLTSDVVGIWRPPYAKVYKPAPAPTYQPRKVPLGMGLGKKSELSKVIQDVVNRPETGTLNAGDINAVKALQRSLGLEADGYFGPATARAVLARAGSLRQGRRGHVVRLWQYIAGCKLADCDGIFGPNTTAWTKKAQAWARISADGIVGPQTRAKCVRA